ncbi:PASTA domain-containing protein, partial [Bacillus atrophaeus]|nr:PASTA domain-containing protein [Bacillus atrophaeus]
KKKKKKEKKKQAKANKKKKRKKWPLVLLTLFFILITSAILALTVFPSLFMPKDVEVPNVAGLDYEEAVTTLEGEGFEVDPNAEDVADE